MDELAQTTNEALTDFLEDVAMTHYEMATTNLTGGFVTGKIDKQALQAILQYPWASKTFSQSVWDHIDDMASHTKRVITKGFASGSSIAKMTKELQAITQKEKYVVQRLVRTESKYFANQSELLAYQDNGVEQYVFMGGTEGSISCNCANLNGKIFKVQDAKVGLNFPPLHPNCKCAIRPYFENGVLSQKEIEEPQTVQKNNLNQSHDDSIIKSKEENIMKLKEDLKIKGILNLNPKPIDISMYLFDDNHINHERNHNVNLQEAVSFMHNALYSVSKWNGKYLNYYSAEGSIYLDIDDQNIRTAFKKQQFDDKTKKLMEGFKKYE